MSVCICAERVSEICRMLLILLLMKLLMITGTFWHVAQTAMWEYGKALRMMTQCHIELVTEHLPLRLKWVHLTHLFRWIHSGAKKYLTAYTLYYYITDLKCCRSLCGKWKSRLIVIYSSKVFFVWMMLLLLCNCMHKLVLPVLLFAFC